MKELKQGLVRVEGGTFKYDGSSILIEQKNVHEVNVWIDGNKIETPILSIDVEMRPGAVAVVRIKYLDAS